MVILITLVGAVLLLAATAASGFQLRIFGNKNKASKNGPFDEGFDKLVNKTLELWKVPGLAIAVVDGDDTWAQVGFPCLRRISLSVLRNCYSQMSAVNSSLLNFPTSSCRS